MTRLMNVRQVAEYLNIKERKVYDLVKKGSIPCSRVAGKWLFPQDRIDRWVTGGMGAGFGPALAVSEAPPVVAGSHDPLLEWALRESGCGLALMPGGSLDGLLRLSRREAIVCGMHVLDSETGSYNVPAVQAESTAGELVLIEWAWRVQGLVFAADNPTGITALASLREQQPRMVQREEQAGTRLLLAYLLGEAGISTSEIRLLDRVARTQTEVGLAILAGWADTGLAVEAVAHQLKLGFLPLHRERYDLAMERRDYFRPPIQTLLEFARGKAFHRRAAELSGYDIAGLGAVRYNGE